MKKLLVTSIMLFILCNMVIKGFSQSSKQSSQLYYKPPANVNGLTPVKVDFSYKVVNAFGTIQVIYAAKCTGDLAYQYYGRETTYVNSVELLSL